MMRTYKELAKLPTFEERFQYLRLNGNVGQDTFGFDRFISQQFYKSLEWKKIRDLVIIRDNGCDLAVDGYAIYGKILIHHMNPISLDDIQKQSDILLDPENLICTALKTHSAIHYGDDSLLPKPPIERRRFDTCPWKR